MTVPFVKGSLTSTLAAESKQESAKGDAARVLRIIREAGEEGVTDDRIEFMTGMRHQNVSARRRGLVLAGLVCDSGRMAHTRSGRLATLWVAGQQVAHAGAPNTRVSRPSSKEIHEALDDIRREVPREKMTPTLIKVAQWLRCVAGPRVVA